MSIVRIKQVEMIGPKNHATVFHFHYVVRKREDVLDKALEFTSKLNQCQEEELKIRIVESEREAGYLNQSYPSDKPEHYKELSSQEISLKDLRKMFYD